MAFYYCLPFDIFRPSYSPELEFELGPIIIVLGIQLTLESLCWKNLIILCRKERKRQNRWNEVVTVVRLSAVGTTRGGLGDNRPQNFDRSVNPISTKGAVLCLQHWYSPSGFSDLPTALTCCWPRRSRWATKDRSPSVKELGGQNNVYA